MCVLECIRMGVQSVLECAYVCALEYVYGRICVRMYVHMYVVDVLCVVGS